MSELAAVECDFFISRTDADKSLAVVIAGIIHEAGYKTWLQDENFGRTSFLERMDQGFKSGASILVLLSSAYQGSDYCKKECNVALARDPLNRDQRLIVLRVGDCAPAGNLSDIPYTDLVPILAISDDTERERNLRRIIRVLIGAERDRSSIDFSQLYRRAPHSEKILHEAIKEVGGFTGREAELEALRAALWTKGGTAALTNAAATALRGMGGVGKTTLARQYAWKEQDSYRGVWWIRGEKVDGRVDDLKNDLIELGKKISPGNEDSADRDSAVRNTLSFIENSPSEKPFLLVYDNVEHPGDLKELPPRTGELTPRKGAHVIITTRWSDWDGEVAELPVDVFTPEVAVDFLMTRARGSRLYPNATEAAAGRLASDLGCLPLALSHARSYCWGANIGFDEYRARLPELIRRAPKEAVYPKAVFATFELAIERASSICPASEKLMNMFAFIAPERIPLSIVTPDMMDPPERDAAVAALAGVSLITVDEEVSIIGMHRLVQEVARARLNEADLKHPRDEALRALADALASAYAKDPQRLFTHVLQFLHVLSKPEYQDSDARGFFDRLARNVILTLGREQGQQSDAKIDPEQIVTLIGNFYEAAPLKDAVDLLLKNHIHFWPRLRTQLLDKNNYVLRHAMADSLADACAEKPPRIAVKDVVALIGNERLYEFEVGGYALSYIYARNPKLIDTQQLERLAERKEYPGRSILGDFLLNFVFRTDDERARNLKILVSSEKFWSSYWDMINLDVSALRAAEAFMASPRRKLSGAGSEAKKTYKSFQWIEGAIARTRQSPTLGRNVRALLEEYWFLGQNPDTIESARGDLISTTDAELRNIMRIFFAHPLWAVGEAAATVLSVLAEDNRKRLGIVTDLFKDKNWRIQLGANEAAFAVRHVDEASIFFRSVERFHNHWNCKIRGMCAENLTAHILNSNNTTRDELLKKFRPQIQYWLETEEDCWVLEHVFRLISTLHSSKIDVAWLFPGKPSRILKGMPRWYELQRDSFLQKIEHRKEELARPHFLTRFARRAFASTAISR